MKPIKHWITLAALGIVLAGCGVIKLYGPCAVPEQFDQTALLGEWSITYSTDSGHWVADPLPGSIVMSGTLPYLIGPAGTLPVPLDECAGLSEDSMWWEFCPQMYGQQYMLEGMERLIFHEDGTYEHSFVSGDYTHLSRGNRWALDTTTPDGPKVKMEGMKYFAEGIAWAESQHPMRLEAEVVDLLRIQEADWGNEPTKQAARGVSYPESGYIYLYPRICDGEPSLVQMVFGPQDPDNQVTRNPVFRRTEARD